MLPGPELERPMKAKAAPFGQKSTVEPMTDDEWIEHAKREEAHKKNATSRAEAKKMADMNIEIQKNVLSKMLEAQAKKEFDGDSSMLDELKAKRDEINRKFA